MRRLPRGRFVQAKLRIPTSFRGLHRRRDRSWSLSPPNLQRLHMPVSTQFLEKLDAARNGQGHAQPGASAEKVIEAALDLLLWLSRRSAGAPSRHHGRSPARRRQATSPPWSSARCGHATRESAGGRSIPAGSAARPCASRSTTWSREAGAVPPRSTGADCSVEFTISSPRARSTVTTGWISSPVVREATSPSRGSRR